ncbi:chorismate-binding protein [Salinarimonas sp.]|uniref:chorismate-binding protein n=1 Tax=Salinarimonas sp. TaxID=2766526 RepID=UPI0032D9105C
MHLIVIDNFDSFTNNIIHALKISPGVETLTVIRNDDVSDVARRSLDAADAIVLSPGPGNVYNASDLGLCGDVLENDTRPILGVCLGHQAIARYAGADVRLARRPVHGREWVVEHDGDGLFAGIPSPVTVVRYHSWIVAEPLPPQIAATARADDEIMALRHTELPRWGVQFHPESIGTEHGQRIFDNFVELAARHIAAQHAHSPATHAREFAYRVVETRCDVIELVEALRMQGRAPLLLESAMARPGLSRFSYVGADFGLGRETLTYDQREKVITLSSPGGASRRVHSALAPYLRAELADIACAQRQPEFRFRGGFIGWFGYELQEEFAGVGAASCEGESAALERVDSFYVFDHETGTIFAGVCTAAGEGARAQRVLDEMEHVARGAYPVETPDPASRMVGHAAAPIAFASRHDDAAYLELIERCRQDITLGESYELCLTNQITAKADRIDSWKLYKLLRERNPCPFASYLEIGETIVVSSSPERFISVDAGGRVEAKPIKGTMRRGRNPADDAYLKGTLQKSTKDRAENLMIVDLLRHDLSDVCTPGSVVVPKLMDIESYPTVHQMVSTVTGQLEPGKSGLDAFVSCFPGGSMTGAPKVRSMEILRNLEAGPRGVYSGSIGWIGYDGQIDQSIVIRTVVLRGDTVSIGCGGAITYLSNPQEELDEIKLKARALLRAVAEAAVGDAGGYTLNGVADTSGLAAPEPAHPARGRTAGRAPGRPSIAGAQQAESRLGNEPAHGATPGPF